MRPLDRLLLESDRVRSVLSFTDYDKLPALLDDSPTDWSNRSEPYKGYENRCSGDRSGLLSGRVPGSFAPSPREQAGLDSLEVIGWAQGRSKFYKEMETRWTKRRKKCYNCGTSTPSGIWPPPKPLPQEDVRYIQLDKKDKILHSPEPCSAITAETARPAAPGGEPANTIWSSPLLTSL